MKKLKIGTCSWKYDSWKGIIYPTDGKFNYLQKLRILEKLIPKSEILNKFKILNSKTNNQTLRFLLVFDVLSFEFV